MKIEPAAFLAIEKSMSTAMRAEWDRLYASILEKLHGAVARRNWEAAETLANELTLKGVVTKVRPRLEELAMSAILFGAHRVTGNVKTTHFAKNKTIPKELRAALDQMEHAVEHDASDYVRKQLHTKLAELKNKDERARTQKDDISDAQLAETGGLLEPEQAQVVPKKKKKLKKGEKTLYVHRDLQNPEPFLAWAKAQGFKTTVPVEDLHVTVCYSKTPLTWPKPDKSTVIVPADAFRALHQFGDATVLLFHSDQLSADNRRLMDAGARSDFPAFRAHMTITYDKPEGVDLSTVVAFCGQLIFGPEIFETVTGFDPSELDEEVLKAEFDLSAALNDAVNKGGKVAVDLGANLTTSRLVTFGFLSQAMDAGQTRYQVDEVLDDVTCPFCEEMNGKIFDVKSQYDRTLRALGTSDPADLKEIAPWPEDMSDLDGDEDELQTNGYGAPPYHPNCRGMLSLVEEQDLQLPAIGDFGGEEDNVGGGADDSAEVGDESNWTGDDIQQLGWDRFEVTDPEVFSDVDAAFEDGNYDEAQSLIDDWKQKQPVQKSADEVVDNVPLSQIVTEHPAPPDSAEVQGHLKVLRAGRETAPIDLKPLGGGKYIVVNGEHRLEAHKLAGRKTIVAYTNGPEDAEHEKLYGQLKEDEFEGPNQPKKKRRNQTPAGRDTDYDDIRSDSSSIAFDSGVSNDANAPLDDI